MRAHKATFLASAPSPADFPAEGAPEVAFAGRSNVGKSSLINTLTGVKSLARTSSTPGRTRTLVWFDVVGPHGVPFRFVDLPGYGYAKVGKEVKKAFEPLLDAFITRRDALRLVVVIMDVRRGPEDEERDFIPWLEEHGRQTLVVLTKGDKLGKSQRFPAVAAVKRDLGLRREPILFSSVDGEGVDELWKAILKVA